MSAKSGRIEKSMLNVLTGLFGQLLSFVMSFVIRTVFIKILGEVYLGLNGLFTNILSVLNLTELGLGTAIVIELYKTVANEDEEKTKQYLQLYRKAYFFIGVLILVAGLIMMPFLDKFVNDKETIELINYRLVFLMYLFNTVFSYFFFAYREAILMANQQEYKMRIISYVFKFLEMILQIITLLIFKSIYVYLAIPLVLGCVSTIVKGVMIGKWFPYILEKPKGKLSKEEIKTTAKNVYSVALYKISGTVINSTDNIILSSYISIILTGIYSNYVILTSALNTIISKIFSSFTASLGNLNVDAGDDIEKKYSIFKTISFLNFWVYGYVSVCMFVLFDPFISIWVGEEFIMNKPTEIAIVANFLIAGLQEAIGTHRAAYGLFYKGRYRPVFSVVLNIALSILFVKIMPAEYGVVAVLLGTMISNIAVSWWFDGYLVHKYAFNMKPWKYYITYWIRFGFISLLCFAFNYVCSLIQLSGVMAFVVYFVICTLGINLLFIALFFKTDEFKYLYDNGMRLIKRH